MASDFGITHREWLVLRCMNDIVDFGMPSEHTLKLIRESRFRAIEGQLIKEARQEVSFT